MDRKKLIVVGLLLAGVAVVSVLVIFLLKTDETPSEDSVDDGSIANESLQSAVERSIVEGSYEFSEGDDIHILGIGLEKTSSGDCSGAQQAFDVMPEQTYPVEKTRYAFLIDCYRVAGDEESFNREKSKYKDYLTGLDNDDAAALLENFDAAFPYEIPRPEPVTDEGIE